MNFIKEQIKNNKTSGVYLAEELGVSTTDISNYIAGKRFPNNDRHKKMAKFLKCKIVDLYPNAKRVTTYIINQ